MILLRELCARSNVVALGQSVPDWYVANLRQSLGPLAARMTVVAESLPFTRALVGAGLSRGRSLLFTSCGDVSGQRSNYQRDCVLEAAQYLPGLRLAMVGASYSAVSPSKSRLLRIAASRSPTLAVRDERSRRLLADNRVSLPVVPDLAFLLPVAGPAPGDPRRRLAVFQMREVAQTPFDATVDLIGRLAKQAKAAGLTPCIAWQVGRDAAHSQRLAEATGLPVLTPPESTTGRFAALNALYEGTAIIFSNRLHALLVAATRGVVAVPLLHAAERKVRGVFEDAGLGDLIVPVGTPEAAPAFGNAAWRTTAHVRIEAAFVAAAARLRQFFDDILGPPRDGTGSLLIGRGVDHDD